MLMRYLLRLESITNAFKYRCINADFLRRHECASTCSKTIFERFLFTKKTPKGELMPVDLCMENHINHTRRIFGKKLVANMEARIHSEVPLLDKTTALFRNSVEVGDGEKIPYNERRFELGEPYVKTYNAAVQLNLWGFGEPNLEDSENLTGLQSGKTMSGAFLNSWSIGETRVASFCTKYGVLDQFSKKRTKVKTSRLKTRGGSRFLIWIKSW
jgi:hypothetical protein